MSDINHDNEIIEINDENNNLEKEELKEEKKEKLKKKKKTLKEKWRGLPRKKKILIILIPLLIILLSGLGVVYFLYIKQDKKEEPKIEPVIIEKDNYRYEDGKLIFLDKNDREIGTYECVIKEADKCKTAKNSITEDTFERVLIVYENGQEIEKSSQIYLDKYVFINDNNENFLYDIKNNKSLLTVKLFKSYNIEKNHIVIENEINKYGLIELTDDGFEYLIRPSYDYLGIVNTELEYLLAQDKDKNNIVDNTGKKLSKDIIADVQSVNDKLIVALKNKTYNLYTYDFEEILSDYDYIGLHDDAVSLVKSNRLYLLDNNLNKLNEEGIRLDNKDYVKKYIYDTDNKLKETKKSYEIVLQKNDSYNIIIGDNTKTINGYEGIVNSNYDYISYFDGKLYFYGDIEKTDVIGTYNCNNLNNIIDNNSSLENCILYIKDDKYSGIYNNEYVIIYDNNSIEPVKYYLYSLKDKKIKGTYSEIDIINEKELNTTIKPIYTSTSYIIARAANGNNKGNYGVLEINSDKISGKVAFVYKKIEKKDNYYLLINIDDSYTIYSKDFVEVSNPFNYIELFEKYYVGISGDKLNVYNYNSKIGILEKDILVNNNEFKIDFTDGFKITINNIEHNYDSNGKLIEDDNNEE